MAPRNKKTNSTGPKGGRPANIAETHPELLPGYMELKPMVYDDLNLPDEILMVVLLGRKLLISLDFFVNC